MHVYFLKIAVNFPLYYPVVVLCDLKSTTNEEMSMHNQMVTSEIRE